MKMNDFCSDFVNAWLEGKNVEIARFLYKYRPFDEYSFDMLDNAYLFLCKVKNLDDPSECTATLSIKDYYNVKTNLLSFYVVDNILEYLRPYCSGANFDEIKSLVYRTMTADGHVRKNYLMDISFSIQELAPEVNTVPFINFLSSIPEQMQEPEMRKSIETLLSFAYNAREKMGICSLSEVSNSAEMWKNYADNSSGYCIEYDMKEYEHASDVFPVVYSDERNTDVFAAILFGLLGKFIFGISSGEIAPDKSQYARLFLTKNTIWQYQKEWRIIGDANEKIKAPKIKTIFVGENAASENIEKMRLYCKANGVELIQHGMEN